MESSPHHPVDESSFAHNNHNHQQHHHMHPAAHQMHLYQQQQQQPHDLHIQQPQQPQQQQPSPQQLKRNTTNNNNNNNYNNNHSQQHHMSRGHVVTNNNNNHNNSNHNSHGGGGHRHGAPPISGNHHQQQQHNSNNNGPQGNNVARHNRNNNNLMAQQNRQLPTGNELPPPFQSLRYPGQSLSRQQHHHHNHRHHLVPQQAAAAAAGLHQSGHHHHQQHNGIGAGPAMVGPSFPRPLVQEGDFPLRILVQSDMVGAIIGRSGSTIKQITQETKAKIDVHREESQDQQEKVITIHGSPDSCSAACAKIAEIILNEKIQLSKAGGSSGGSGGGGEGSEHQDGDIEPNSSSSADESNQLESNSLATEFQLKILAHNSLIGRLIGRSGNSIKKIMEQTSTKIKVSSSNFGDCTHERTITVVGNLEQVGKAEQEISSKLRSAYMIDMNHASLQAVNQPPYLFNNVPLSYLQGPYAQNSILSTLVNSQPGTGPHALSGRPMPNVGGHQSQLGAPQMYTGTPNFQHLSLYPNMPAPQPGAGILGFNHALSTREAEKETVDVYIPDVMVGAIIGKSGSAIKEMTSSSGAFSIRVAPASTTTIANESSLTTTKQANQDDDSNTKLSNMASPEGNDKEAELEASSVEQNNREDNETLAAPVNDKEEQPPVADSTENKKDEVSNQPSNVNSRQQQQHSESSPITRKVTIVGTPDSQWSAQYLIYRKISIESKKRESDISLMVEIQVPSQLVGRIIGKGGATVKQIQKQTRATIRLPDEKPTDLEADSMTPVQIIGEFQCSQMAQRHIRSLIRDNHYPSSRQNKGQNRTNNSSTTNNNNTNNNNNNTNNTNNNNNHIESNANKSNAQANFIDNHQSDIESMSTPDEGDNGISTRSNEKSQGEVC